MSSELLIQLTIASHQSLMTSRAMVLTGHQLQSPRIEVQEKNEWWWATRLACSTPCGYAALSIRRRFSTQALD